MKDFDSDGLSDNEWEDRGELAWNEFDWERYLREQDESIRRYLELYTACPDPTQRIDKVAEQMNWGQDDWTDEEGDESGDNAAEDEDDDEFDAEDEVYTLHKNPIFIATKAIYLGLTRSWQNLASEPARAPQGLAVDLQASLHRGEEQAVQAIHALDFGDYAMAISLFKRALRELNHSLALVNSDAALRHRHVQAWREQALSCLFDLREIWLRVVNECRGELERPTEEED